MSSFAVIYGIISACVAVSGLLLSAKSFTKEQPGAKYMGWTCLSISLVDISYYFSILTPNYFFSSLMSSIYFLSIDWMLLSLFIYTIYFTRIEWTPKAVLVKKLLTVYAAFDSICLLINPFFEIEVHYIFRETSIAMYKFQPMPLFGLHLLVSYVLVGYSAFSLLHKAITLPEEYSRQYRIVTFGMFLIVAVNAVFLYLPGESSWNLLDYSIMGYCLVAFLFYWTSFQYSTHQMLNQFKSVIFENIDQGLVLFDNNGLLILHNAKAKALLPSVAFNSRLQMKDFVERCEIEIDERKLDQTCTVQCFMDGKFLRCDYNQIRNKKQQVLGRLFVFTNASLETDLLTGFHNIENFRMFAKDNEDNFPVPTTIVICDINNLGVINSRFGKSAGDRRIRELADSMREIFPKGSYFVRGEEADLIAICYHTEARDLRPCMEKLDKQVEAAAENTTAEQADILVTMDQTERALQNKKLLNASSVRSELIASLVRAMEECDQDTKDHVERTQKMGAVLGEKIQLTELEQSQLSLLCLLHDIGKIAIPLEILNKPGKLNAEEWKIMQSHAEKGYQIAKSSHEISEIADAIRHHHERWDGKGYPDGLNKESIPILSRIISVVDAYDAMTNNRVYRPAMTKEEAIAELKRGSGTQFDPYLVAEFVKVLHTMEEKEQPAAAPVKPASAKGLLEMAQEADELYVHDMQCSRYFLDDDLNIIGADPLFYQITGYESGTQINQLDLIPEEARAEYLTLLSQQITNQKNIFMEHEIVKRDGKRTHIISYGRKYFDTVAKENHITMKITEVESSGIAARIREDERQKAMHRMRRWEDKYRSDSLTGLLTHNSFIHDVEAQLAAGSCRVLLVMIDVDHFKQYNDTYGHQEGDKLLLALASLMKDSVRGSDLAGRMGGDEFALALILDAEKTPEEAYQNADSIYKRISKGMTEINGAAGISMGAALSDTDCKDFDSLYRKADKALYSAKGAGRGQIVTGE